MAASHQHTEGVHVPYGKDGDGFYSLNTLGCFNVIKNAEDLALQQAAKACAAKSGHAPLPHTNPLTATVSVVLVGDACCSA